MWRTSYTEAYARMMANVDPHSPATFRVNGPLANFAAVRRARSRSPTARRWRVAEAERARIW